MHSLFGIFLLGWISAVGCFPFPEESSRPADTGFIGKGTNELATALLQGYVQKEESMAYSPFGYSAILAIFSEGARGASREEIANALHFPSDVTAVREAFRTVLERFVGKKFSNSPEFKNWFYIYKNYTVEEELQNVLRKYYLTEVKCVDRPEQYLNDKKKAPAKETMELDKNAAMEKTKSEAEKPMQPATDALPAENAIQNVENPKSEDNSLVEPVKAAEKSSSVAEKSTSGAEQSSSGAEKDSGVTENSKYKGEEDIAKSETVEEKMVQEEEKPKAEEVMMAPIKTEAAMGLMPLEHFSGMTDSSLRIRGQESKPRMVIFNGLYYKGEWETPFEKKPADDSRPFYLSDKEKVFVSTIHSQGVFNYGTIQNLDCRAIELPYKGGRYSLLVLVPNSRDGLSKLISDLSGYSLRNIYDQLSEKQVDVCLPSFEINTISKPISSATKLGLTKVTSIFSPETADLSGISSKDSGLYVEELVQMVTFKVDADYSKANFLTASIASSRSNVQSFRINQPFLFYLRDNLEDIIIVNGKVIDPTPKPSFYFS